MKTVTIEELLSWAFVHELPKGGGVDGLANVNSAWRMLQASSWGKVTAFAELMTLVDTSPGGGNYLFEQGEPHDDALAIGEAVATLVEAAPLLPRDWWPLPDWRLEGDVERALAVAAVARAVDRWSARPPARRAALTVNLVVGSAILGRGPNWDAPQPKVRMVMRSGKPAWFRMVSVRDDLGHAHPREVDGFDARRGRRHRDAYRKYEFADDPVGDIMGRIDHLLWRLACASVAKKVSSRLVAHRLAPSDLEEEPWRAASMSSPRDAA